MDHLPSSGSLASCHLLYECFLRCRSTYPGIITQSDLVALNPALDVSQPLITGTSLCVGYDNPATWCNTALLLGICPPQLPVRPCFSLMSSWELYHKAQMTIATIGLYCERCNSRVWTPANAILCWQRDWSTKDTRMTPALNAALSYTPDLGRILQDKQVRRALRNFFNPSHMLLLMREQLHASPLQAHCWASSRPLSCVRM